MIRSVRLPISRGRGLIVVSDGTQIAADFVIAETGDRDLFGHAETASLAFGQRTESRKVRDADDGLGVRQRIEQPTHRLGALLHGDWRGTSGNQPIGVRMGAHGGRQ